MGEAQARTGVFGRASATLSGAEGFTLEQVSSGDLEAYGIDRVGPATVLSAFRITAAAPATAEWQATVRIVLDGDPSVLVAFVSTADGDFAFRAEADGPDRAAFSFDVHPLGVIVQILELPSAHDVELCLETFAGGGAFGPVEVTDEGPVEPTTDGDTREPARRRAKSKRKPVRKARSRTRMKPRSDATAEAEEVLAHVLGEMPSSTKVGDRADVTFTLSWLPQAPSTDTAFDQAVIDIDPGLPVSVSISARGYRLLRGARRTRSVRLKSSAAKVVIRFTVEAVDAGRAEVTLVVRQRHELPLATLRLVSEIVTRTPRSGAVDAATDAVAPDSTVTCLPTLRIDESVVGRESVLDIAAQIGTAHASSRTRTIDKSLVVSEVYEKIGALRARLKEEGGDDQERMRLGLVQLRAIGVELSRRVFSRKVREFLWENVDELDDIIIQTTGEFDIPWEIIYVSDPARSVDEEPEVVIDRFLGMRGATRWVYNTAMPKRVTVGRGRAKYLCPAYLDPGLSLEFTREEGELVRRVFHARVVRPGTAAAVSRVVTSGFDLLHFGGHGVWTATPPDQRLLLARYRKKDAAPPDASYSASDLRRDLPDRAMIDPASPAPMVFLNACDVGRFDTSVVGLGGFPEAFLRGGIGVLLGCSWAVDDKIAKDFVRLFYDALADSDIAGAMRRARTQSLANADLSALAYVAYAHPRARVTIA